ncbi:TPA: hypothetical protein QIR18_003992 [Klebsiella aerogenes]|uniref:hypothetical protein n=1 Tax=Klebsiella aerogenes TaxID=548 RepID=UPI0004A0C1B6|nr:hypothetical protein [Klebsiella aerogenes]KDF22731.1 hypothetical protein AF47_01291 [Klebsiella aerogenes MGH 61]MDQ8572868.1 hypothetical protein [Klebsiella aerogenes]MDQ8598453.1 hypothetical protein [Klebsiella aerogenes]HDS5551137.1 hypothetical protein [Klebsiella aerogenes]HEO9967301.1 hypothetical protein [Klebsiella aerogenes]
MEIEDIQKYAFFLNLNGKMAVLGMEPEQKRFIALMALNTADGRVELIEVSLVQLQRHLRLR